MLLAAGMRDWSLSEWASWYAMTAAFLTATLTPLLAMLFNKIGKLIEMAHSASKVAELADQKATNAQEGVVNANNRITNVAALSTPKGDQLAIEKTLEAVKDAVEKHP